MDVAVDHKRGQRLLRAVSPSSVFGEGLLERARATSLSLLGFTTAVGLTIVALVFNQGWPLPAGGPVPAVQHQSVGEARVASGIGGDRPTADVERSPGQATAETGPSGEARTAPVESSPPTELVVAPSAPARSDGGDAPRGDSSPEPTPAKPAPESPPAVPSQPAEPPPAAAVEEPEPPATASEAPPISSVPPWSNGKGHAYGRSGESPGHGHEK